MAGWLFLWLALSGFMFVSKSFLCDGELPGNEGTLLDFVSDLIGFSGCTGIAPELQFFLTVLMWAPGLVLLAQIIMPVISGAAANPIVGILIGVSVLVG